MSNNEQEQENKNYEEYLKIILLRNKIETNTLQTQSIFRKTLYTTCK